MKIRDLIQELKKYPLDKEVVIRDADEQFSLLVIQGLEIHPEYVALYGDYDEYFEPKDKEWCKDGHYEEINFS